MDDWNDAQCDADVLTQVLAASQQEYLDSLKTAKESETSQSRRNSSEDSNQEVEHRAPSGGNNNGNGNSFRDNYSFFGIFGCDNYSFLESLGATTILGRQLFKGGNKFY